MRDTQTYFWYGNAATRTFGRAHRHRPYDFVWADCVWTVGLVWADYTWDGWWHLVGLRVNVFLFVWIARGRLISFRWIARGWLSSFLHYSARMPLRIPLFMLFISVAFIFSMDSDEGI